MKNFIPLAIIFFLLILLISCSNNLKEKINDIQNDKINLSFVNVPVFNNSIKLKTNDLLTIDTPFVSYNTNNNFLYKVLELTRDNNKYKLQEDTIYLRLRYDFDKFETYIFFKGDSVLIDFIKGKPKFEILNRVPKKYDYQLNTIFDNLTKPLNQTSFIKVNHRLRNKKENEIYKKEIKNYYTKCNIILDSLKRNNILSDQIFKFKKKEFYYSLYKSQEKIAAIVKDSNDLHIDSYKGMLLNFAKKSVIPKTVKGANGYIFNSKKGFDLIMKSNLFNKQSKEFLLWSFLKEISKNFSKNDFNVRYNEFVKIVEDNRLVQDINERFLIDYTNIKNKTNDVFLIDVNKNKTSLSEIIEEHRGKVIYIDFWASWCMPCRKVMPDTKTLINKYRGTSLVFIFMSIDKNLKAWQDAFRYENLDTYGHSYLILNYPDADFFKKIDLSYIPRYVIFDKKGNLIYKNALSPNDTDIIDVLDEYISK